MPPSPGVTTGRRHEYGQFQHRIPSAWLAAPWQLSAKCPHPGGGVNGERRRSGLIRSRDNTGEPAAPGAHRRNLGSVALAMLALDRREEIGRAECRERVCQYV